MALLAATINTSKEKASTSNGGLKDLNAASVKDSQHPALKRSLR